MMHRHQEKAQSITRPSASLPTGFVLDADDAKLLTEIGFQAAYSGDILHADAVFDGLLGMRPGRAYPWVGKTLARFYVGQAAEAAVMLDGVSGLDTEDAELLQAWRGLALQLSGQIAQGHALLETLVEGTGPGNILARALLGLPDKE